MLQTAGASTRIHSDLPIFRLDEGDRVVLNVPGRALPVTVPLARQVEEVLAAGPGASPEARAIASELVRDGSAAALAWRDLATRPFEPECLTLYLSNRCNLACRYCYAAPADEARARIRSRAHREPLSAAGFPLLSEATIRAAARLVASHCAAKDMPLTLVLHGGGEPTLHWELLQRARKVAGTVAAEAGVGLWSYIATHGVLAKDRVRWLAGHFDLIGISCDGPPDMQNANRPSAAGRATAATVERTARTLRDLDADYAVRATITPDAVERQTEIVEYLCDRLFARALRFEPVYDGRRAPGRYFRPEDAERFVASFLRARTAARERGCDLELSAVQLDELHGPFCNPLREVLQLTPDGTASACFLSVGGDDGADAPMLIGRLDPVSGAFRIDGERVAAQRRQAARIPARCRRCHNLYHCSRDCPDVCLLTESPAPEPGGGFRCRVQMLLGRRQIFELAAACGESLSPSTRAMLPQSHPRSVSTWCPFSCTGTPAPGPFFQSGG
jgi:uncharacterized protein